MARILTHHEPFPTDPDHIWLEYGHWPACWVDVPGRPLDAPSFALFRLRVTVAPEEAGEALLHVSADNRYLLALDGAVLGRGPERGAPQHWHYESYQLHLTPGEHVLTLFSWWLGETAPNAQMTIRPGVILAAEGAWLDRLSTGRAPWEGGLLEGYAAQRTQRLTEFTHLSRFVGPRFRVDASRLPVGWLCGESVACRPVETIYAGISAALMKNSLPYWRLTPATLPPMLAHRRRLGVVRHLAAGDPYPVCPADHLAAEAAAWQALLRGEGTVTVPAGTRRTAIIDLEDYYCAYHHLRCAGGAGAQVALCWAEGLYVDAEGSAKGQRDEIAGKYFLNAEGSDLFLPCGDEREFTVPWWESGRYVEVVVQTAAEPLTLLGLEWEETRYPLAVEATLEPGDPRLAQTFALGVRTLESCMHETYMDCPYYEQLMYACDTRIHMLITYMLSHDARLPKKAMTTFDLSRDPTGFVLSSYPIQMPQRNPSSTLFWALMFHDYWRWRDDHDFIRQYLPALRSMLEYFRAHQQADGLLRHPHGWNFLDWPVGWKQGMPTDGHMEPFATLQFLYALVLQHQAAMEDYFGEPLLAQRDREAAALALQAADHYFWDEARGLYADTLPHTRFTEHAQSLAVLNGHLSPARQARVREGLLMQEMDRTTIYFSYYLFAAYRELGMVERIFDRMGFWFGLPAQGFHTLPESPEPGRSDCHAWGGHPIIHYVATFLGITPAAPGFRAVSIAPHPGPLTHLQAKVPHPRGFVAVTLERDGNAIHAAIDLPKETPGTFTWQGETMALTAGRQEITCGR